MHGLIRLGTDVYVDPLRVVAVLKDEERGGRGSVILLNVEGTFVRSKWSVNRVYQTVNAGVEKYWESM